MASGLDMSLDDLIKTNRTYLQRRGGGGGGNTGGRGRGRFRGGGASGWSGPGPARRFPNRPFNRSTPYHFSKATEAGVWAAHDMYSVDPATAAAASAASVSAVRSSAITSIETGTRLYISNLDYGVSNEDIRELFSEVGDLKKYSLHYDKSGRSKGTAEVVYTRRMDAQAAVKRYNNVQLDGKPMKIEIVGTNIATPGLPPPPLVASFGTSGWAPRIGQGRGDMMGRAAGGRGFGRGRGRGRSRGEKISAEELDAEIDKYQTEAMQIN